MTSKIANYYRSVSVLVSNGHHVVIEHNAGEASHFRDKDYSEAGTKIVYDRAEVFKSPILVKSAPVIEEDLPLLQMGQVIISPIHLSVLKAELLEKMMEKKKISMHPYCRFCNKLDVLYNKKIFLFS